MKTDHLNICIYNKKINSCKIVKISRILRNGNENLISFKKVCMKMFACKNNYA